MRTASLSTCPGCFPARKPSTSRRSGVEVLVAVVEVVRRPAQEIEIAADLVIEHGDVSGRLIRDEDFVVILAELAKDPSRRDHVVIRMR